MCDKWLDKVTMDSTGISNAEKFKFIEWDFLNPALLTRGNQAQELEIRIDGQDDFSRIRHQTPVLSEPEGQNWAHTGGRKLPYPKNGVP